MNRSVSIVAPSSPFDREKFDAGVKILTDLGFHITYDPSIFDKDAYLAGNQSRRLKEFIQALRDPATDFIMAARGGYGFSHLMPHLWKMKPPKKKKTLIGFSDFTLAFALGLKWKWPTIHSPMVGNTAFMQTQSFSRWKNIIAGETHDVTYDFATSFSSKANFKARGILRGGCLTLLAHSVGTPWAVKFPKDTILFLEDTNEKAYAIDRFWTQLVQSTHMTHVKAVVWGQMSKCLDFTDAITRIAATSKIPHVVGLPVGHDDISDSLMMHKSVELTCSSGKANLVYTSK